MTAGLQDPPKKLKDEEQVLEELIEDDEDDEKYASAIVPQSDDPTLPTFTFRVLVLGTFWCLALGGINAVLAFRTNAFAVDAMLATLLSYPLGIAMSLIFTTRTWKLFGLKFSLNPGPFSIKEHVLISIIGSAGAAGAYGIDNVIVQKHDKFIGNENIGLLESLAWVFATQFIGYGLAGLSRRFLVKPKAMLWPGILGSVALYVTLHKPDVPSGKWTMSRYKFFWISFIAIFIYTWIPEYFMVSLQAIALVCLVSKNKTARFLGSGDSFEGVGMGMISLDWYYIGVAALTTPFVYMANFFFGNILYIYVVIPVLHYTNAFNSPTLKNPYHDFPVLNSVGLFNRNGTAFRAKSLYQNVTFDLNMEQFNANKPIYISEYFAMNYIANFLALSATFAHVGLWYGKDIIKQAKKAMQQVDDHEDIHNQLMKAYKDVPEWGYAIFLAACIAFMCLVVSFTHFHMPIWAVFLGVGITGITLIPLGTIEAITGTRIYLNVLSQMVIGLILPGKTISVMAYKSLGTNSANQALTLISDLKLGHYMKVSPWAMVICQLYGTFVGAITTTLISWFVMISMDIAGDTGDWQSIGYKTFYNAGAIWGAIGPARFFGIGTPYEKLLFGFLIGFLLPFIPWIMYKFWPNKFWRYINIPLIVYVSGAGGYQNFVITPFVVNLFFQFYLFRYQYDWWKKYNYVFAAAISGAVSVCVIIISILKNLNINPPYWPGNPNIDKVPIDYYCLDLAYDPIE